MPVRGSRQAAPTNSLTPVSTTPLTWQGGYVLHQPQIFNWFWGSEWNTGGAYTTVMNYTNAFATDLGGSPWAATMQQYCSGTVSIGASSCPGSATFIGNPTGQLKGSHVDTSSTVPASPTDADIQNEATLAANFYGNPTDALYFVFTPQGKSESGFGTQFCGYHSATP